MPEFTNRAWAWIGQATTLWGLLPVTVVGAISYALGSSVGFPAQIGLLLALGAMAASFLIIHFAKSRRAAYSILAVALLLFTFVATYQYDRYSVNYQDVEIGLAKGDPDGMLALGLTVTPVFRNENTFDLWYVADRHLTTVNGPNGQQLSSSDQKPRTGQAFKNLGFGISDSPIVFDHPLYSRQLTGGNIDYHFCYGRTKAKMAESLTLKATYTIVFDEKGPHARVHINQFKHGNCGSD